MKVYDPGTLPEELVLTLPDSAHKYARSCTVALSSVGACLYNVHHDHIMIMHIEGSGIVATLAMRPYIKACLPIYFLGHTPHVIEWGKKYFEEVGTLFRYKGGKHD